MFLMIMWLRYISYMLYFIVHRYKDDLNISDIVTLSICDTLYMVIYIVRGLL